MATTPTEKPIGAATGGTKQLWKWVAVRHGREIGRGRACRNLLLKGT
jgi:hypothetical protein